MYRNKQNEDGGDYAELKRKLIWQMTGEELVRLLAYAVDERRTDDGNACVASENGASAPAGEKARNLGQLAAALGCGYTTVSLLKKSGVLDAAVTNTIGNRNVYDVAAARRLADEYYAGRKGRRTA